MSPAQTTDKCDKKHKKIWTSFVVVVSLLTLFAGGIGWAVRYSIGRADAAAVESQAATKEAAEAKTETVEVKAVLPHIVRRLDEIKEAQIKLGEKVDRIRVPSGSQ